MMEGVGWLGASRSLASLVVLVRVLFDSTGMDGSWGLVLQWLWLQKDNFTHFSVLELYL